MVRSVLDFHEELRIKDPCVKNEHPFQFKDFLMEIRFSRLGKRSGPTRKRRCAQY